MYFNKYPYRANFVFAESYDADKGVVVANGKTFEAEVKALAGDIYHINLRQPKLWGANKCLEQLTLPEAASHSRLTVRDNFDLNLKGRHGALIKSVAGEGFGVSGEASLFQFEVPEGTRFFGMGAKNLGTIELSGYRTKFWNTDVWSDFHPTHWGDQPTDPPYFSTPYVAAKIGEEWVGFLIHNPYPAFIETPGVDESRVFVEWQRTSKHLVLGTEGGEPNLWVIYGTSLKELTRKLQKLIGVTPAPPLWSIGYQQSRYGYGGHDDLTQLDTQFRKHEIPCDAIWLDLDYMDGFRVFQTSAEMFPAGTHATASKLAEHGKRIVPILDPGVKLEPGYRVYDDGHKHRVFCENAEGREFVGLVWPGETVFPDFTLPKVREWWAGYVKGFAEEGFGATWIDMNDPSTGPVDPTGMLFNKGKEPHAAHHNQYALGMQMATKAGLLQARPAERPFILSRSGYIGTNKHAAIWTGDNVSNYFYLKISIPTTIGLSLSGMPFNGPDVGGFGGDADESLIVDWFKAAFLFPFFRNHSMKDCRSQEPFSYPLGVMRIIRRYIRLRYKLLPYLYNLFLAQEEDGDPILRPLLYSYDDDGLELISDQFLVGEDILQAPFVDKSKTRGYTLPGAEPWYDGESGRWVEPGKYMAKSRDANTPLFLRAGAIVPMRPGTPTDSTTDLLKVNFHVFAPPAWSGDAEITYQADDGISFGYKNGERSRLRVKVASVDGNIAISTTTLESGFGEIEANFVIHGAPKSVRLNGSSPTLTTSSVTLTGKPLEVTVTTPSGGV